MLASQHFALPDVLASSSEPFACLTTKQGPEWRLAPHLDCSVVTNTTNSSLHHAFFSLLGFNAKALGATKASDCSVQDKFVDYDAVAQQLEGARQTAAATAAPAATAVELAATKSSITGDVPIADQVGGRRRLRQIVKPDADAFSASQLHGSDAQATILAPAVDGSDANVLYTDPVVTATLATAADFTAVMPGISLASVAVQLTADESAKLALVPNPTICKKLLALFKASPSELGNSICNGGPWNTRWCGYDLGDC
jgi:hypothetical protein